MTVAELIVALQGVDPMLPAVTEDSETGALFVATKIEVLSNVYVNWQTKHITPAVAVVR